MVALAIQPSPVHPMIKSIMSIFDVAFASRFALRYNNMTPASAVRKVGGWALKNEPRLRDVVSKCSSRKCVAVRIKMANSQCSCVVICTSSSSRLEEDGTAKTFFVFAYYTGTGGPGYFIQERQGQIDKF